MDTELSCKGKSFVFLWRCIIKHRVTPFSVVEDFDIVKQAAGRFRPTAVPVMVDPLGFQQVEEAFRDRIVITIAPAAHAAHHFLFSENFLVITRRILTALIRVVHQSRCGVSTVQRHL